MKKKDRLFTDEFYIFIGLVIIATVGMILFSNWRKNQCLNKNGKVIEDNIGLFDKCIYGDKK